MEPPNTFISLHRHKKPHRFNIKKVLVMEGQGLTTIIWISTFFSASLAVSYLLTLGISRSRVLKTFLLPDLHKPERQLVPGLGGLAPMLATILLGSIWALRCKNTENILLTITTASIIGFLGLMDDVISLKKEEKVISVALVVTPLVMGVLQQTHVSQCGEMLIAPVLFVLIASAFIVNATNTLAGFNGIEAGLSSIIAAFLLVASRGMADYAPLIAIFLGATLGFLILNFYPAKIFPSNVGSFFFGGFLASYSILVNRIAITLLLFIPHLVDFLLKLGIGLECREKRHALINANGRLVPPDYRSLLAVLINRLKPTERSLVLVMYSIEAVLAVLVAISLPAIEIWLEENVGFLLLPFHPE